MNIEPHFVSFEQIGTPVLGYISIAEAEDNVPFKVKRVYWTYFTPNHVERGNHAHINLEQIIVSVSGIIKFKLENVHGQEFNFILDEPSKGLYIPPGFWREMQFSHNAVLLCLASLKYEEKDYIRDYQEYREYFG